MIDLVAATLPTLVPASETLARLAFVPIDEKQLYESEHLLCGYEMGEIVSGE